MEFKNGNIVSLSVKNFQTFKSQKFQFGPALNLIAAPNGSGKSSIANAIAFAFNGMPKTIGKTKDISEYIRFGCKEAEIIVEVFFNNRIYKMSRKITQSQNQYFIDSKMVLQKEYYRFLDEMKIDVNNLCTFLPQERVGEFSRMNPKELLEEMLKNSKIQIESCRVLYDDLEKVNKALESNDKKMEMIENTLNILETGMKEIKEREENELRLKKLEFKKDLMNFEHYKQRYLDVKREFNAINLKVTQYSETVEQFNQKIEEAKIDPLFIEYNKNIDILNAQNKELKNIDASLKSKIERMEICKLDRDNIIKREQQRSKNIEDKKREIEGLSNELKVGKEELSTEITQFQNKIESICDSVEFRDLLEVNQKILNKEIKTLEDLELAIPTMRKIDSKIQDCNFSLSQIQNVSQSIQKRIEDLERQKNTYSERDSMKLEMLKKYHQDTYKGVLWLRENKGVFRDEVFEPLYLHLDIDESYTKYVEPFLSFQALSSFIVKNDHDFTQLTKILKDKFNLSINVAVHAPSKSKGISKADIKRFNLNGVLSDFIHCRQEYMDFLNTYGHFNTIPISVNEIKEEEIYSNIPDCKRMAVGNRYSEIKRSRYGDDFVIITSKLHHKNIFSFPKIDIDNIENEIAQLQKEREINKVKFEKIFEEKDMLNRKKAILKNEFDTSVISKFASKVKRISKNIEFSFNQLKEFESYAPVQTVDKIGREIDRIETEITNDHHKLKELLDISNIPVFNLDSVKNLVLDIENHQRQQMYFKHMKIVEEERLEHVQKTRKELREIIEEVKNRIRSYPDFDTLDGIPVTTKEIEDEIMYLQAKLSVSKTQEHVKKDYNEKQSLLRSISEDRRDLNKTKQDLEVLYDDEKIKLTNEINLILNPVKHTFEGMFERFGFKGTLELDTSGRDWELKILVKFRENEDLQQLSSFRQSGGEKSLTTVLFLLSLQQCESTPFRLVDEINQGMDHFNERRVFDILRVMGDRSQFFIITPKLIKDLEFSENTTAIIVYGGPGITKDIETYTQSILG